MSLEKRMRAVEKSLDRVPAQRVEVPQLGNVIDFCVVVLGWMPYPPQALVMKLAVGADDLMTIDDLRRLDRWCAGYATVDNDHFVGELGTTPDILRRAELIREAQRWCFRQITLVLGRRGGKTQIAAALVLWQVWRMLCLGDPQSELGIVALKTMAALVYSTNRDNAGRDVFGDIRRMVERSAVLGQYVDAIDRHRISFFTPRQIADGAPGSGQSGSLIIEVAPTTATSARGPAVFAVVVDEAAFLDGLGSTADTEDILRGVTPALAQFTKASMTLVTSSPATKTGKFYDLYRQACAVEPRAVIGKNPDAMMLHLASWDMYEGWQDAHLLEMIPGGRCYDQFPGPIIARDSPEVDAARRNDDVGYRVEFLAQWAEVRNAYFPQHAIESIFAPFLGAPLEQQRLGVMGRAYHLHIDPSDTRANTAIGIAHVEQVDLADHLVIDYIGIWKPSEFDAKTIDYRQIVPQIVDLVRAFDVQEITLDGYAGHVLEQWINAELTHHGLRTAVHVLRANHGEKAARYDHLRGIALQGLLHCPDFPLTRQEFGALQQDGSHIGAPTSGPVQTDDTVDAIAWLAQRALDPRASFRGRFGEIRAVGARHSFPPNPYGDDFSRARIGRQESTFHDPARGRRRPY
jgi:hypothetical protein